MIRLIRLHVEGRDLGILSFIVGFAIGAGILGLPVVFGSTGAGFLPSVSMLVIVLVFQIITALYIIEGIMTYGSKELPKIVKDGLGSVASTVTYVFVAVYLLGAMTAYVVFGGVAITTLSHSLIPSWGGTVIYWLLGVAITLGGVRAIASAEKVMVALIVGLLGINVLLLVRSPQASIQNLAWGDWSRILDVFGVVLFAYAIHAALPTAYRTMGGRSNYPALISAGMGISALVYMIWSAAYMSVLEPADFHEAFVGTLSGKVYHGLDGLPAPVAVAELGILPILYIIGFVFGFLTTFTSFIAASHALTEINSDCFAGTRLTPNECLALTTVPPLIIALLNLGSFIDWLNFAGAVGAAIFTGIVPCALAIKLRITKPEGFKPLVPGGLVTATITLAFYLAGMIWYVLTCFMA